jgi:hypothetical protein
VNSKGDSRSILAPNIHLQYGSVLGFPPSAAVQGESPFYRGTVLVLRKPLSLLTTVSTMKGKTEMAAKNSAVNQRGTKTKPSNRKASHGSSDKLETPVTRPLKAYAFDPSRGKVLGNEMYLKVRYQKLAPGPVVLDHRYDSIAVVDYDGANNVWYKPVNLDDWHILMSGGLDPSESDPRFHQQMVYAVVTETIQHFETALGRRINWRRAERDGPKPRRGKYPDDIYTLNLYPHAMYSPNAFYSPKARGILFGYFKAVVNDPSLSRNLPGQMVYTCLSHDIIVHETTHAVIDGMRKFFTEQTNIDVPAFHEGLADIVALFRHFAHKEVLLDTIQRTGGALYKYQLRPDAATSPDDWYAPDPGSKEAEREGPTITAEMSMRNPLVELAQQFGEASGRNRGLRSALGTKPNSSDIRKFTEPHRRGSILVAPIFDAFFSIYLRSTADLFRIYRAGGGRLDGGDLPDALANRLAGEAARIAERFFQVCVRAIDYCSPVDITFGDYLRAIVTAEYDLRPTDEVGVRDAFMQAFRLRGIVPESASFFSESAIAWPRPDPPLPPVPGLDFGDPNGLTNAQKDQNGDALRAYANNPKNRKLLGFDRNLYVTVPSFHPMFRINPDGSLRTDMVVELTQKREALFDKKRASLGSFRFRGGVTLIISKPLAGDVARLGTDIPPDERPTRAGNNAQEYPPAEIRYVISKHLHGTEGKCREERQRHYGEQMGLMESSDPDRFQINFAMVHEGEGV